MNVHQPGCPSTEQYPLIFPKLYPRESLAVHWLGLHGLTAKGLGLIPGQGTKIPQAKQHDQGQGEKTVPKAQYLFLKCEFHKG